MERKRDACIVYGSWYDSIMKLRDKEEAFEYLKAIMDYQFYGEYSPNGNDHLASFMEQVKYTVDRQIARRDKSIEDGAKGGRKKKYDYDEINRLLGSGMSVDEVAKQLGCSTKTVQRARKNDQTNRFCPQIGGQQGQMSSVHRSEGVNSNCQEGSVQRSENEVLDF